MIGMSRGTGSFLTTARRHESLVSLLACATIPFVAAAASMVFGTNYPFDVAALAAIYALATMGLSILYGWTGQISLAQAGFFGLGAYATAFLRNNPPPVGGPVVEIVLVIAIAAGAGLLVGVPALRISGLQLAIATLAFAEVFVWALTSFHDITGGTQGIFVGVLEIGPLTTADSHGRFALALILAAIGGLVMLRIRRTPIGRSMAAIRDSELAAQSVGIRPARPKLWAFVLSAVFAGVAGWMFANYILAVTPGYFTMLSNVYFLVAVTLGGRGTLLGAWIGGAYLVVVPEVVRGFGSGGLFPAVSGLLLIIVMLLAPRGIARLPETLATRRERAAALRNRNARTSVVAGVQGDD